MIKSILLTAAFLSAVALTHVASAADPQTKTIRVPDATAVRLSLSESLSSATNDVDDPARFEVTEDVLVRGAVVIPKGSTAVGHVVEVEPKRRLGRAGKLNITLDHVKAIDSSNLRLRANTTRKGEDRSGTVIVGTALLTPLFLIMRGKDVTIPKGTPISAYIDGDREISISGTPEIGQVGTPSRANAPAPETSREDPATVIIKSERANAPTPETSREDPATVIVKSDPEGADIIVDGQFLGNTPSTIQLSPKSHLISIGRPGYRLWQREVTTTSGGIVTLNAGLEKGEGSRDSEAKVNRQIPH